MIEKAVEDRTMKKPEPDLLVQVIEEFKYGDAGGLQAFIVLIVGSRQAAIGSQIEFFMTAHYMAKF
jgi:hypothetical protein